MKKQFPRWVLYLAVVFLYLLHNDLWFWNTSKLVLGLPVGLLYHIGLCLLALVVMTLLVNYAWPRHLKTEDPVESE